MSFEDYVTTAYDRFSGAISNPHFSGNFVKRLLTDWKAERGKLIKVLEWIKLQPQKCQKIMREHNWKYEDSEDFNQKMIFTMYSHVVGCAAKSEYILIEVKEKGG